MIDEETQHRLKELEEEERMKEMAVKAQLESTERATQEKSDSEHEEHVNENGIVNEEVTNGVHENDENGQAGDEQ